MDNIFKKLGHIGRMISGSKSVYCFQYPTHEVYDPTKKTPNTWCFSTGMN
jgi:hypothetical protein